MSTLSMIRARTVNVTVTIQPTDSNNNPILGVNGVTGWSFWMTAKRDANDADAQAVFQKLPVAFTIVTPGNASTAAVITCVILATDTAALPAYQLVLVYDVQAKDGSGNLYTVDSGTITVSADVTIATS